MNRELLKSSGSPSGYTSSKHPYNDDISALKSLLYDEKPLNIRNGQTPAYSWGPEFEGQLEEVGRTERQYKQSFEQGDTPALLQGGGSGTHTCLVCV